MSGTSSQGRSFQFKGSSGLFKKEQIKVEFVLLEKIYSLHGSNFKILAREKFSVQFNRSEKAMVTDSSTLAWKIPWTEDPGRLHSMGSQRVRQD